MASAATAASAAEIGVLVIGGGAVGLSVAVKLAERQIGRSVLLVERHAKLGLESSSHNSEVIHASVYYPPNSLKARLCRQGNDMMYALCKEKDIPHANIGKLLVPKSQVELRLLPRILATALASGGQGVKLVNEDELRDLEPNVNAPAAIYCPTTGIIDSHALLQSYETSFLSSGGDIALNAEVVAIKKYQGFPAYKVEIEDVDLSSPNRKVKSRFSIQARSIVNCAGLGSARVAALAGIDVDKANYRLHPTKGVYFRVHKQLNKYPKMLVYPLPINGSVGVHTTPDLHGGMRLGPLETWFPQRKKGEGGRDSVEDFSHPGNESYYGAEGLDLSVGEEMREKFVESVRPFLPFVEATDIAPESSGIHSKLQSEQETGMRDWVIKHEVERGLANFYNLVGIESPGLTASPAIGEYVAQLVHSESK
ncbi:fad dependent oxidoreductase [Nannochloropsis oceanica]